MRRWASVLIRGVVQETPAPRRPACPARESGTAVPDKRTKAVPGDEPRDRSPRSITYMEPSRIYADEFLPQLWTLVSYPLLFSSFGLPPYPVSARLPPNFVQRREIRTSLFVYFRILRLVRSSARRVSYDDHGLFERTVETGTLAIEIPSTTKIFAYRVVCTFRAPFPALIANFMKSHGVHSSTVPKIPLYSPPWHERRIIERRVCVAKSRSFDAVVRRKVELSETRLV